MRLLKSGLRWCARAVSRDHEATSLHGWSGGTVIKWRRNLLRSRLLFLLLELLGVTVKEEVDHDIPGILRGDGAAHLEDHAGEEVVKGANGVFGLVVGGDSDVDVVQRAVAVAEGDDGEVSKLGLTDRLVVHTRVCDNEETRLHEDILHLVAVGAGGVATGNCVRAGVLAEFDNGALAVGPCGVHDDVIGILNGDNHTSGHKELVPGLAKVVHVYAVLTTFPNVALHLEVAVLGA